MSENLSIEEMQLLHLLQKSLTGLEKESEDLGVLSRKQWENLLRMAKYHAVLPLLYEPLEENQSVPNELFDDIKHASRQTVLQNYKLLYLTNYVVKQLEAQNISVIVLKGVSTANRYPIPEYRKSGDVDLLVARMDDFTKACNLLEAHNFIKKEKQLANHHLVFESKEGIKIELHVLLAEPFDNERVNQYLRELSLEYHNHIRYENIIGSVLPVPEDAFHAYYLLLHMLQHFLRSGFGVKLLCDWVVFWNQEIQQVEKDTFLQMVSKSGLDDFTKAITSVCIRYLGLEEEKVRFITSDTENQEILEHLIKEILEAEEFGKSRKDRMVVMRGTSLIDYIREFHHQMCLNYPKANKIVIIWPILWTSTLLTFLYNNKKVRKISSKEILKKAKARSKIMNAMNLFERH